MVMMKTKLDKLSSKITKLTEKKQQAWADVFAANTTSESEQLVKVVDNIDKKLSTTMEEFFVAVDDETSRRAKSI